MREQRILKRLNVTLTLQLSVIFIITAILLFTVTYILLSTSLKRKDHDDLRMKYLEIWAQYQTGGLSLIQREIVTDELLGSRELFFVRITDPRLAQLFFVYPQRWNRYDYQQLDLLHSQTEDTVLKLQSEHYSYKLEVIAAKLYDGNLLQVGISTENRELFLKRYRSIFASLLFLLILFSFIAGLYSAFRSLRPIHNLTATVRAIIDTGRMDSRLTPRGTGDELDVLILLFNEMLDKIDSLIGRMREALDNVAHDLRTPLTRFRGTAEIALQTARTEKDYRESLIGCLEESEKILTILKTLTDISEAETGAMHLDKETVDISRLFAEVLDLYAYVAEEKRVALRSSLHENLTAEIDPNRIRQAIGNIVDNAIKYTPDGGSVQLKAYRDDGEIVIRILDTGIGISTDDLPNIWDRLYRGTRGRTEPGLGLGLSLVKAYVEAHGGRVTVTSHPGEGSEFAIALPA